MVVNGSNSLVGTHNFDNVGVGTPRRLTNGNYIVSSPFCNGDRGAVTWVNGATGLVGEVSSANSLVGTTEDDEVGEHGIVALANGNYVVNSERWNNGAAVRAGAVTWGNGLTGVSGAVSAGNSLVGTQTTDFVGFDSTNQGTGGGIRALPNGDYLIKHSLWNNGPISDAQAVTFGKGDRPLTGPITDDNSVRGRFCCQNLRYVYDPVNHQVVVGKQVEEQVTILRFEEPANNTPFDFDGDGKTDIGIFRPSVGEWWYQRSSDGQVPAFQFG